MNTITDLSVARSKKNPTISGVACCSACKHEWAAVAPVGTVFLACPSCHTNKARFVDPVLLEPGTERLECQCGCQLFSVTRNALVCINCGTESDR